MVETDRTEDDKSRDDRQAEDGKPVSAQMPPNQPRQKRKEKGSQGQ